MRDISEVCARLGAVGRPDPSVERWVGRARGGLHKTCRRSQLTLQDTEDGTGQLFKVFDFAAQSVRQFSIARQSGQSIEDRMHREGQDRAHRLPVGAAAEMVSERAEAGTDHSAGSEGEGGRDGRMEATSSPRCGWRCARVPVGAAGVNTAAAVAIRVGFGDTTHGRRTQTADAWTPRGYGISPPKRF